MDITIDWQRPVQLTGERSIIVDANNLPLEIQSLPGVYFFARWYGDSSSPFYIGESLDLRTRLKQHLNTTRIEHALLGDKMPGAKLGKGPRYFHYGYLRGKTTRTKECIEIVEREMLREAIERKKILLNLRGTIIETHNINFVGAPQALSVFPPTREIEA